MSEWLGLRVGVLVFQLEALFPSESLSRNSLFQGHGPSSPALPQFWHITKLLQKPGSLELKGDFGSKGPIPFKLQMRN